MFQRFDHRFGHLLLLGLVWALLCLPGLGGPSLWDIDEGNNAQVGREMLESGNWVVPTFNYDLREDKPPLLYWLQLTAFRCGGVSELTSRLPSALAALLGVLLTYELGRVLFGARVGLLAGLILASTLCFCGAAHFANPDALLHTCTLLSLLSFWLEYRSDRPLHGLGGGLASGLAVLAKGPVGLVLPLAVVCLFLFWQGQLRRLLSWRLLFGGLVFLVVAAPWYVWVGLETKGAWLAGFWYKHNTGRFLSPMEKHGGPFYYYLLVLVVGLAPWSIFLGPALWYSRPAKVGDNLRQRPALRFLLSWMAVYLAFFSIAQTKLPNYILPLYPAAAVLLARFLERWRRGLIQTPGWMMPLSLSGLVLTGVATGVGLLIAGGWLPVPRVQQLPGLERWAFLGLVPVAGALVAGWCLRRGWRQGVIGAVALTAVVFMGGVAASVEGTIDAFKAPRPLTASLPADQTHHDIRVAAFNYFQPSLVFYCQRKVERPESEARVVDFLAGPLPAYLFVPAADWQQLEAQITGPHRVLDRHLDLYTGKEIILVANHQ
jgi:4-amino-4-deoxy-L-arabinose transferase-like glycosyltransferase